MGMRCCKKVKSVFIVGLFHTAPSGWRCGSHISFFLCCWEILHILGEWALLASPFMLLCSRSILEGDQTVEVTMPKGVTESMPNTACTSLRISLWQRCQFSINLQNSGNSDLPEVLRNLSRIPPFPCFISWRKKCPERSATYLSKHFDSYLGKPM